MPDEPRIKFTQAQTKQFYETVERRVSSAGVFCETKDGKLLINKANYKRHWSIPGGIIDAQETPREAAVRETFEEMGITLDANDLRFVAVIDRFSKGLGHTYQFIFTTQIDDKIADAIVLQADEIDEFAFISAEEVFANKQTGGRWLGKAIFHWAHKKTGYIEQTFSYDE